MRSNAPLAVLGATLGASITYADIPPDYGFDWATIGDPGNRATNDDEVFKFFGNQHLGAVDYTYRISTTEVTVGQYFEFVEAYLPYYEANTGNIFGSSDFTGGLIRTASGHAHIRDGISENRAAEMSWEYAARYVNWLHNGKATNEAAFETGVYDTSTFTQNDDGSWNHQLTHNPGASFWIPTRDEMTKAAYWDPSKNNGEGGYWLFPGSSDDELIPGLERNAGDRDSYPLDVGSFPDIQSPWGLLDVAGGVSEWLETIDTGPFVRFAHGSDWSDITYGDLLPLDTIGYGTPSGATNGSFGLRLASVPAPGTLAIIGLTTALAIRRRR